MNDYKVKEIYQKYGIRPPAYRYLTAIFDAEMSNEEATNSKLAKDLNVSNQRVGVQASRLARLGLIENCSSHPIRKNWRVNLKIASLMEALLSEN